MNEDGLYIYCVSGRDSAAADMTPRMWIVSSDLAALVTRTEKIEYQPRSAGMLEHLRTLEEAMSGGPLLPVRFATVAENEEQVRRLLEVRRQEFLGLLQWLADKSEFGLRVFWANPQTPFDEIMEERPDLKSWRDSLRAGLAQPDRLRFIEFGQAVKEAFESKRQREAERLLSELRGLASGVRILAAPADRYVANAAFLVASRSEEAFDGAVEGMRANPRYGVRYVGPAPPYNFVEIHVRWDEL
jgi:hypothetical protein